MDTFKTLEPFQVLWGIFTMGVVFSFAHLAVYQLRLKKPHIAAMGLSYALIVVGNTLPGNPYDDWRRWMLVVALVLGVIGLVSYYRGPTKNE